MSFSHQITCNEHINRQVAICEHVGFLRRSHLYHRLKVFVSLNKTNNNKLNIILMHEYSCNQVSSTSRAALQLWLFEYS